MRIYQILTGLGVILGVGLSVYMKNMTLGFIFVVVPGMLWFYSASYKRQLIIGNLIVAVAAALVPLIPLIAESGALQNRYGEELLSTSPVIPILYKWVFAYSVFFFFFTFISEVIKDMRDQEGDREMECHTVPIVWGENKARIFVSVLTIIAVLLIGWAAFFGIDIPGGKSMTIRYFLFGIGVPSICMIYILWLNSCNAYKNATTLVWFIMAVGLLYSVFHYYLLAKIQGLTFFGLFNIA